MQSVIVDTLKTHLDGVGSASEIDAYLRPSFLSIAEVQRYLDRLTEQGQLVKLAGTIEGQNGQQEHLYQLIDFDGN